MLSRRRFLGGTSLLPLATLLPHCCDERQRQGGFLGSHESDVVREATARLIPGPEDDPLEAGHPGAREANVVGYVDRLLSAFDSEPPAIFAGGPFSERAGGDRNDLERFVPLSPLQERIWRERIERMRETYRAGIALLDELAGGDFAAASGDRQDEILSSAEAAVFRDVLFVHAIEGTYGLPEYGGNRDLVGWSEIGWPGDRQPTGYSDAEVSESDGSDPAEPIAFTPAQFEAAVRAVAARRHGGR